MLWHCRGYLDFTDTRTNEQEEYLMLKIIYNFDIFLLLFTSNRLYVLLKAFNVLDTGSDRYIYFV